MVFPAKIAAEQCSSEQTAAYKQRLVNEDWTMCDLTGGLGIDSYFFSRKVNHLTYIERFPAYCEAARHNFSVLGADNITVINTDTTHYIGELPEVDAFYIDPAGGEKAIKGYLPCRIVNRISPDCFRIY